MKYKEIAIGAIRAGKDTLGVQRLRIDIINKLPG